MGLWLDHVEPPAGSSTVKYEPAHSPFLTFVRERRVAPTRAGPGTRQKAGRARTKAGPPRRRLPRKERHRPGGGHAVSVSQPYQSAWTAVPLCSVVTVPLALHAITAGRSDQLSIPSCQCLAIPAGDS